MSEWHFLNKAPENVFTAADMFLINLGSTPTVLVVLPCSTLILIPVSFLCNNRTFVIPFTYCIVFIFITIHNKILIR